MRVTPVQVYESFTKQDLQNHCIYIYERFFMVFICFEIQVYKKRFSV